MLASSQFHCLPLHNSGLCRLVLFLRIQLSSLIKDFHKITSKKLCRLPRPILLKRLKEFELLFLFLPAKGTKAKQPGL